MAYADRIFAIVYRLLKGEKITTKALAEEFNVTQRAIQHDMSERLPLELMTNLIKDGNSYYLDPLVITGLFPEHIQKILKLVDAQNILPHRLDKTNVTKLLLEPYEMSPFLVQSSRRMDLDEKMKANYRILEKSIKAETKIAFSYKKNSKQKRYENIEPYKLIDYQGIWYLAAVDVNKIKTFTLSNISMLNLVQDKFSPQLKYLELINRDESIWLSENKFQVELTISEQFIDYFQRRNVIPNQIITMNEDKTASVKAEISSEDEIIPIIRYWLPAIVDIKPDNLKSILLKELSETFERLR